MPQPHHWIGLIRMRLGDTVGAEQAFRAALEREPGRAISEHGLGMAPARPGTAGRRLPAAGGAPGRPRPQAAAAAAVPALER
ncbi:tetratricopeptide repeat protein [Phenylobacterium sp. J367]|uniref:tetratricopeptide repeat protein n=1 Tax=Phenylobacterium sp. J367 TaxID=2898435 RepID=UPI002151AAD3|nr:tetratricopeptide repeat protein [Phenylobacterium sp. J367]MCR5878322.1 hypothetical protein [Phenylobacterium sp. J367]